MRLEEFRIQLKESEAFELSNSCWLRGNFRAIGRRVGRQAQIISRLSSIMDQRRKLLKSSVIVRLLHLSCGNTELTNKVRIRLFLCKSCGVLEAPEAEVGNHTMRCDEICTHASNTSANAIVSITVVRMHKKAVLETHKNPTRDIALIAILLRMLIWSNQTYPKSKSYDHHSLARRASTMGTGIAMIKRSVVISVTMKTVNIFVKNSVTGA